MKRDVGDRHDEGAQRRQERELAEVDFLLDLVLDPLLAVCGKGIGNGEDRGSTFTIRLPRVYRA